METFSNPVQNVRLNRQEVYHGDTEYSVCCGWRVHHRVMEKPNRAAGTN